MALLSLSLALPAASGACSFVPEVDLESEGLA